MKKIIKTVTLYVGKIVISLQRMYVVIPLEARICMIGLLAFAAGLSTLGFMISKLAFLPGLVSFAAATLLFNELDSLVNKHPYVQRITKVSKRLESSLFRKG